MTTVPTHILARRFPQESTSTDTHCDFFEGLLSLVRNRTINDLLGEKIKAYVLGWLSTQTLDDFNDFSDESYVRTYLGRCPETHWEAILMSWKQGNLTSIHAHPQFAGYHFADGIFQVEIFEPVGSHSVRLIDRLTVDKPAGFFAVGKAGAFDNHIHRISCLSETGHSLHVYSDNALKGQTYDL